MPKKTVREMNEVERAHYGLASRAFHSILALALILSVAAIGFGFYLYTSAVRQQYTDKAHDLSVTIASLLDGGTVEKYTARVREIYDSAPAALREDQTSEAYMALFSELEDEEFRSLCGLLEDVRTANGLASVYIGVPDGSRENFIFVLNSDPTQDFRRPGRYMALDEEYVDAFSALHTMLPALITQTDDGGYVCTGSEPVYDAAGGSVGNVVVNIYLNEVAALCRSFLWRYCLYLLVVAVALTYLIVRRQKKVMIAPINALAAAALAYVEDKKSGVIGGHHFRDLNIRTGDEVENLSLIMADMEADLGDYVDSLTRITAEKERISTELELATRIQADMLPNIYPAFPERPEFDIYASMDPAKEVGGDFYDFFLIDDDHLGIVMADVSGKGVPAALFMMISKILVQNYAMTGRGPAEVLRAVNEQICSNNREEMFVTVWFGILDTATGKITAANAGHEYPALMPSGGRFELVKDKHGFVIGGMEGVRYKEYELTLAPGSKLFLYTDGVPEATDSRSEMFGTDRMLAALNEAPDAAPERILHNVREAVDGFVRDAEQFDDLTMLCLEYRGLGDRMDKLTDNGRALELEAAAEKLPTVLSFVERQLEAADCPLKAQMQIGVAVEEIFVNIAHYAYAPDVGRATVRVDLSDDPAAVTITFTDRGRPYDPLAKEDPDVTLSAEEREIGGLGIFMVKKSMDDVTYEYRDGQNILRLKKNL